MAKADALAPDATLQAVEAAKQVLNGGSDDARVLSAATGLLDGALRAASFSRRRPRQGQERGRGRAEGPERRRYCRAQSRGGAEGLAGRLARLDLRESTHRARDGF